MKISIKIPMREIPTCSCKRAKLRQISRLFAFRWRGKSMLVYRRVVRHDYKALYQHLFFHSIHIHQYTKQFHAQIRKASKSTVQYHSFGWQLPTFCCYLWLLILFWNTVNCHIRWKGEKTANAFYIQDLVRIKLPGLNGPVLLCTVVGWAWFWMLHKPYGTN